MGELLLNDGRRKGGTRGFAGPDIDFGVVDWDFPTSRQAPLHALHPYPAKFIPEIPSALISLLPPPKGTAVLDPFCGSGTTLVEAQHAGFPSVGIDLNPVAILLSRVKTGAVPKGIGQALSEVTEIALLDRSSDVPEIPRLDHWFKRSVQIALARLGRAIAAGDPACRDVLRLAMSSIIVRASNQDSDTRYAAVQKKVDADDVFRMFVRSARNIIEALVARAGVAGTRSAVSLMEADILQVQPRQISQKIGLVVTSPPYPNAYEYWLYHKYRMWWLGFDPLAVKDAEIGARAHFFGGKKHTALDFEKQMERLAGLLGQVVVPSGHACFVVGRSRIHGVDIDNAAVIGRALEDAGFERIHVGQRTLRSNRKSFNLSHANIKTETVLIARRSA